MRSLMTFLIGALFGAGALFLFLRTVPDEPAPAATAAASATPPGGSGVPAARIEGQLPDAPLVEADLSVLDLPLRPSLDLGPGQTPPLPADAAAAADAAAGAGKLLVPVQGVKAAALTDTFEQPRGRQRHHEALDIMAAKGTPVLAAADGKVVKLFQSKPGGTTLYQFDPSERYAYYYAHLDRYADGIKEGMEVKRGDVLGYVGVTGNSDPAAPHLHFAMFELTPAKQWWQGTPMNPHPLMADTVTP